LSESGALGARRDKRLAEQADGALSACMHGRFSSFAKRADVSLSGCCSLSAYVSLNETSAAATFLFFIFSPEIEVKNTLIHNEGNVYCIKIKLNKNMYKPTKRTINWEKDKFHNTFQYKS